MKLLVGHIVDGRQKETVIDAPLVLTGSTKKQKEQMHKVASSKVDKRSIVYVMEFKG